MSRCLSLFFCFENGSGAVATVLQNDHGKVLAGLTWLIDHALDATTAEAIAILSGLVFLERLGCSPAMVESDSLELI